MHAGRQSYHQRFTTTVKLPSITFLPAATALLAPFLKKDDPICPTRHDFAHVWRHVLGRQKSVDVGRIHRLQLHSPECEQAAARGFISLLRFSILACRQRPKKIFKRYSKVNPNSTPFAKIGPGWRPHPCQIGQDTGTRIPVFCALNSFYSQVLGTKFHSATTYQSIGKQYTL